MRIGIDVDGVLIDNTTPTLELLFKKTGIRLTMADLTHWNAWEDHGLKTGEILRIMDEAYIQKLVGPAEPNLGQSLSRLRNHGNKVIIITKRTPKSHPAMVEWIHEHRIPYDGLILCCNEDNKLSYPIDCLIDDHPKGPENAVEYPDKKIFLRDQPWNRNIELVPNVQRVQSIKEVVDLLQKGVR